MFEVCLMVSPQESQQNIHTGGVKGVGGGVVDMWVGLFFNIYYQDKDVSHFRAI